MRLFNFSCFAVLSIDNCDDPESDPDSPALRGLWSNEASARLAVGKMEAERLAAHEQSWKGWGYPHPDPSITRYAIVSLTDVEASDLSDLETKLETAARLNVAGIGK